MEGTETTYSVKKGEYTIEINTEGIEEPETDKLISIGVNDTFALLAEQYPMFAGYFNITGDTTLTIYSTFE